MSGQLLPVILQGTGHANRIGNSIQYKFLRANFQLVLAETSVISVLYMRFIVFVPLKNFVDTDPVATKSFIFDIGPGGSSYISTINQQNVRVLQDKRWIQGSMDTFTLTGFKGGKTWRFGKKIWNKPAYNNINQLPENPKDLVYWCLLWGTPGGNFTLNFRFISRLSFKDI